MSNGRYTRTRNRNTRISESGPFEAVVVNHLDPRYMGALEVEILRYTGAGGTPERSGQLLTVRYLSPFYGVTPSKGLQDNDGYQFTQKSYGWWAVPPDIGTKVLVIFAEGNANFGYWIGCIQDDYMNFMIPDGRASTEITTPGKPPEFEGVKLPVGEYNKKVELGDRVDPTLFQKPYNKDFTNVLEVQGLLKDEARGTTTTSARREIPSMVFGISTPGPLDKRLGAPKVEIGADERKARVPFNRLGGSSFVMDDGDDKFVRMTHAEDGPPIYANREAGETDGDDTIPQNELVRIRTRTGHQILLHNSEDLIYIANSRGTAWIELTSDGKIDIHAQDSISIMSDNDINFTAERDFNIEAGRNINMKATARWSDGQQFLDSKESGRIHLESVFDTRVFVGKDHKITVKGESDTNVNQGMKTTVKNSYHLHAKRNIYQKSDVSTHHQAGQSIFRQAIGGTIHDKVTNAYFLHAGTIHEHTKGDRRSRVEGTDHLKVIGGQRITVDGDISRNAGLTIYDNAGNNVNVKAAGAGVYVDGPEIHLQGGSLLTGDAGEVHWNSGKTIDAEVGLNPATASTALANTPPTDADPIEPLPTTVLPYVIPGSQNPVPYDSILTRAPQHEPWMQHENMNPQAYKKEETDREEPGVLPNSDRTLTPDTFAKNLASIPTTRTVYNSANSNFTGGTGDGLVNDPQDFSYEFDPNAGEGNLVDVYARRAGLSCQVAEVFAPNFQAFLDDFEATGYEIKRLGGYSKRRSAGGSGSWSVHASGGAIDINWPDQVHGGSPNGFFSPRPANAPITDMPANTLEIANRHGLGWGGAWRSLDDAMHFSAHTVEGGSFRFPRNGKVPPGPSNNRVDNADPDAQDQPSEQFQPEENDTSTPTLDPPEQAAPGVQNADGTARGGADDVVVQPDGSEEPNSGAGDGSQTLA